MPKRMNAAQIRRFFEHLQSIDPEPVTELNYTNEFELLAAVMLSAQSTDVGVNKATAKLYPVANTPAAILKLGEAKLKKYIATLGLYNSKAKHLIGACEILVSQHGGEIPRTRKELEALPGVGRKTANVVLNVLFGEPTMAVDTHIFRVGNRTGLAPGKTPLDVEKGLLKVIPKEFMQHAHHWLILHGRYTCIARKPRCPTCAVSAECQWPEKSSAI
ncbi:endonuclease III [Mariprofundus micogutta]|uniref:Endonuclease III n=2 Tax=Mariprofundus micogutta TaxID=1921010 RepID=A0A1L8CLC5_9PROT|nr:endonuclease III [Mariprofundus micogutta]